MSRKYDWTGKSYTVVKPEFIRKQVKKLTDYDFGYLYRILVGKQNEALEIVNNYQGVYSEKTVEEYRRHLESIDRLLASFDGPSDLKAWEK